MNYAKIEPSRAIRHSVLRSIRTWMHARSNSSARHAARVAVVAVAVGQELGLDGQELEWLRYAAELHDVGKLAIRPRHLREDTDPDLFDKHPLRGIQTLAPISWLTRTHPAILHHHENWDGTGHPFRLGGEEIPLHARIIRLADVYDHAVQSGGLSAGRVEGIVKQVTGTYLDPDVVRALDKIADLIQPIGS